MICPFCQAEMQKGHLSGDGRRGITWWPAEGPSWNRVIVAKSALSSSETEALYCESCKKIVVSL
jgi:hypothetical protein